MPQTITTASLISPGAQVTINPWATNPLADDALQVSALKPKAPAPKMFTGGTADLPAFTASGIDPRLLLDLPFTCRHYVAALASPVEVHGLFELVSTNPTA